MAELHFPSIRRALLRWYRSAKRDLPWRRTSDPYRIWVSEIMLQQTRVAAALPFYERFLRRFPDIATLAAAPEEDVLAAWSGLGYYSRARNLQKAARLMAANGGFPHEYENIRALPGVGEYTAAAVASIAFDLPHAAVDGNVERVMARLSNGEAGARELSNRLLDRRSPGDYNQAVMELGATVCLPKAPRCLVCPLSPHCEARRRGTAADVPVRARKPKAVRIARTLLVIQRRDRTLLWPRASGSSRMAGFWELPEPEHLPNARRIAEIGRFRHTITHHRYEVAVWMASIPGNPDVGTWLSREQLASLPLSTLARKALRIAAERPVRIS